MGEKLRETHNASEGENPMKKILFFFVFLIVLVSAGLASAYYYRDLLLKMGMEQATARLTGFKTKVDKLHFDFPSTLLVQGLKIHNPAGFHEEVFASIPEIYIALDLSPLLHGERIHLQEVRLHLQEIHLEKNERGISNVSLLSSIQGQKKAKSPQPTGENKAIPFHLDRLVLTIRQVYYADYSGLVPKGMIPKGIVPTGIVPEKIKQVFPTGLVRTGVKEVRGVVPSEIAQKKISMDLNIEKQVFLDIKDPKALVNLIAAKILYGKTFGNVKELGVDPNELLNTLKVQNTVKDVMGSGQELFQQTTGLVTQNVGGAVGGTRNQITGFLNQFRSAPPDKKDTASAQSPPAA